MHIRHVEIHAPLLTCSTAISCLPGGVPPMWELISAPRESSASALRRLVVGPKPGRIRPTAPRRASAAHAASLIRSTWKTRYGAPRGAVRADAVPGTARAATAAKTTVSRRTRRERKATGSLILADRRRKLPALPVGLRRLLLEELFETRRALECHEPRGAFETLLSQAPEAPAAACGGDCGGRADEAAEQEVER